MGRKQINATTNDAEAAPGDGRGGRELLYRLFAQSRQVTEFVTRQILDSGSIIRLSWISLLQGIQLCNQNRTVMELRS